jgi:Pyruvate/2-oxoacid:ferredoxin oxidoreductase gamma subunit
MSESAVLMTGVGGQGVQLLAKTLALGAMRDGWAAMMTAEATEFMRGGHSAAAVVVSEPPLLALPVVNEASFAMVLHPTGWDKVVRRLRPDALIVVNELFTPELVEESAAFRIARFPANELASEIGSLMASGLVLLGCFASLTGIVNVESLVDAMTDLLPPYRKQHSEVNAKALRAGAAAGSTVSVAPVRSREPATR